ncbi:hypothetical protein [Veillonella criceti]|uniref:Uncharacterized protein n=1 Tax=Veillonella criceti TaxID=103891 RepID=A0A380NHH4_9FIRM|nr:hypothetical protein [Veillonella criceti]SUP39500.1 Uncharacterised protein [Veillonella criceti]
MLFKNLELKKGIMFFFSIFVITLAWRLLMGLPFAITKVEIGGIVLLTYSLFLFKLQRKAIIISFIIAFGIASLILLRLFTGTSLESSFIKVQWSEGLILSGTLLQIVFFC